MQYFLTLVQFAYCTCCILRCLVLIVVILCVFVVLCVYCCFYFRCRTAGQKSVFVSSCDRPPRHRFFLFPCVYKQMVRQFPRFQVANTCSSCSPPELNLLVTNFIFCIHVKNHCHRVTTKLQLINIIIIIIIIISTIRQAQQFRLCVLVLFDTTTCFDCSPQPSLGRTLVHRKSKNGEASPCRRQE